MGYSYEWICTQCKREYKMLAGKGNGIMAGTTYPYYCINCSHLSDYLVCSSLDFFTPINPEKCHNCEKKGGLKKWDIKKKPCTTLGCNGHLEIDDNGIIAIVD